jgi:hypothetical protein
MKIAAAARPEPTLLEELRSSALLFGLALGTTAVTVAGTQLLLKALT